MLTNTALQDGATGFAFFSEPFAEVGARMSEGERDFLRFCCCWVFPVFVPCVPFC